jgi:hypothetical protein
MWKVTLLVSLAVLAVSAQPLLADSCNGTIYAIKKSTLNADYATLYSYDIFTGVTVTMQLASGTGNTLDDIAFNTDGRLYGVGFTQAGDGSGGAFWSIDIGTNTITRLATSFATTNGEIGTSVNALCNYAPNKFYAAVDNFGSVADTGHLYDWTLNLASPGNPLSGNDVGRLHTGSTLYSSVGDLWYQNGILYGTVTDNSSHSWLATIDPTDASVTKLASVPYNNINSFPALTQWNGYVALIDYTSDVWYWDGTSLHNTYVHMAGYTDTTGFIRGGTAYPVPEPVTICGVLMAFGGLGTYVRRRMKAGQA